jgi:predicted protein tyrosine phosphatase
MPFIENRPAADIPTGHYKNPGENSMLIQIMDPCCMHWPIPKHTFKEIHQFEFLDVEEGDTNFEEFAITDAQATELVRLLHIALDNDMNVIVHCHAGICRSGAVAEVANIMGFDITDVYRQPNLLVKYKMMKVLDLTYEHNNDNIVLSNN